MTSASLCLVCGLPPESGDSTASEGRCSRCGVSLASARLPDELFAEVASLARRDRVIDAIRYYRGRTGTGLKEAKDAVEQIAAGGKPQLSLKALQKLTGVSPQDALPPAQRTELERLVIEGKMIEAIRRHRQLTRSGLKEAKEAVEALEAALLPSRPGGASRPRPAVGKPVRVLLAFVIGVLVALLLFAATHPLR